MLDKYGTGQDPYAYANSTTLINKLNIRDSEELANVEIQLTTLAIGDIDFCPPPYDLNYLCSLHKTLFGDIYTWAGQLRSIAISKQDTRFCQPEFIIPQANKLFKQIKQKSFFEDMTFDVFCKEMAEFYIELNMIHPFREGNGRTQRLLFEHIAINNGYNLNFSNISAEEWIQANIIGSLNCEYQLMVDVFQRSLSPIVGF